MTDSPIPSFGKLHHLGSRHAQFVDTPGEDIEYTEKIDGSQFSFMLEIGRASCRERVEISVVAVSLKTTQQ